MPPVLQDIAERLQSFVGEDLAAFVDSLEQGANGLQIADIERLLVAKQVDANLFSGVLHIKRLFGRIDEVIHATGILLALPKILLPEEKICGLSLAAGNTGQSFDLETTHRIAEFTFITWQGGSEVIRQNKIFKDFFFLAEETTPKRKELYVLGTEIPLKFFGSRRKLKPILEGNAKLSRRFEEIYPDNPFAAVSEYYQTKVGAVSLCDLSHLLPPTQPNA